MSFTRYKKQSFYDEALAVGVDVSLMGLADEDFARFDQPMARAFAAMDALEKGAIANPTEQRCVGHYWLRAPDLAPEAAFRSAIWETVGQVEQLAGQVTGGGFRDAVVIGIGGSALGPQMVCDALARGGLTVHFLDNTDPDGIDRLVAGLTALEQTLCCVISKSGGTKETRNAMLEMHHLYREAGLDFGQRAVAITQQGSKLDGFAQEHGFLARLPMWDWVGGRTSVTSAVGLLPAALCGVDVRAFLSGARAMDKVTRGSDARTNPAALLAMAWHHAGDGRGWRDMVVIPYKDRLSLLARYLQQLVMESLGKRENVAGDVVEAGLTVYGNKGSTDQHAYVQQLLDGPDRFFVTFVEVLQDRHGPSIEVEPGITSGDYLAGFMLGTRQALHDRGRSSLTITLQDVDALRMGALIALFERAVGLYATLVGINAYDQPGVESGKRAAADILALQSAILGFLAQHKGVAHSAEAIAAGVQGPHEAVYLLLRRLAANDRITRRRHDGEPWWATFLIE